MIERHINGRSVRYQRAVSAVLSAFMLFVLPGIIPVKVLAAEVQSYAIPVEELQTTEPEELPEYGAVKTADASNSTAICLVVLLVSIGQILDRIYLSSDKWEDKNERGTV